MMRVSSRSRLLLPLALIAAACAAPTPDPPSPTAAAAPAPAVATATDGRITLRLELPRDTWGAGEPIDGMATLSLEPGPAVALSGSGGPIGFAYAEVGGPKRVEPVFTADCAPHPLAADNPITQPLSTSGAFVDGPDAGFYRAFLSGKEVRLPAGDWDIGVLLALGEGPDCSGRALDLAPSVRIHVLDAAASPTS